MERNLEIDDSYMDSDDEEISQYHPVLDGYSSFTSRDTEESKNESDEEEDNGINTQTSEESSDDENNNKW